MYTKFGKIQQASFHHNLRQPRVIILSFDDRRCNREDNSVSSAVILQSPDEWKKILVIGVNAESIQADLTKEIDSSEFSKYIIFTQNMDADGPLPTKQLAGDNPLNRYLKVQSWFPMIDNPTVWNSTEACHCELLIVAEECRDVKTPEKQEGGEIKEKERAAEEIDAIFAVVPAHLMIPIDEKGRVELRSRTYSNGGIRRKVEEVTTSRRYTCSLYENGIHWYKADMRHPPLLSHRFWIRANEEMENNCPHLFLNDMALLRVEQDSAVRFQQALMALQRTEKPIYEIKDVKHLQKSPKLAHHNIAIGEFTGKLTRCPIPTKLKKRHEDMYVAYAPFKLFEDEPGKPP